MSSLSAIKQKQIDILMPFSTLDNCILQGIYFDDLRFIGEFPDEKSNLNGWKYSPGGIVLKFATKLIYFDCSQILKCDFTLWAFEVEPDKLEEHIRQNRLKHFKSFGTTEIVETNFWFSKWDYSYQVEEQRRLLETDEFLIGIELTTTNHKILILNADIGEDKNDEFFIRIHDSGLIWTDDIKAIEKIRSEILETELS